MTPQLKSLIRLELCNLFGRNTFRHTRDSKVKNRGRLMLGVWIFLILLAAGYVGGLVYGLILLNMAAVVPAYLITISSLMILALGMFKAGSALFVKNGYDMLASLPVRQADIVISRFVRLYVENLLISLVVMVPGMAVYGWFVTPELSFYLLGTMVIPVIPLIPLSLASIAGAVIIAISSRMKHKNLVSTGLQVLLVLGVLLLTPRLEALEGTVTPEMLAGLADTVMNVIGQLYVPAVWMGKAMAEADVWVYIGCLILSVVVCGVAVAAISVRFHWICTHLYSSTATHDYEMGQLKGKSVLTALWKRELKRYFSSSIYVTNTIIGPILGTVLAVSLIFVDTESVFSALPMEIKLTELAPILLAGVFTLMTAVSVSVSMEGKEWWIAKSLPLSTKQILDGKLMMNMILILPFYVISEIALMIGLRPDFLGMIWMMVIPATIICFALVWGITINLCLPMFDWESDVVVVKQSGAAMLGGMGGFLVSILFAAVMLAVPDQFGELVKALLCGLLAAVTVILYRRNSQVDLREVG